MKRIYISILFAALAVSVAAVEAGYVGAKADTFIAKIEQADRLVSAGGYDEAVKLCTQAEDEWYESAKKIDMLLIHDYVDDIGISISRMRSFAESGDEDSYFAESTQAKKELASIKESEYPYIENIL